MSGYDDVLTGLRRSDDPADRRLADVLDALRPGRSQPAASDSLAAFLAANQAPEGAARLDDTTEPAPAADLAVVLPGRTPPRSSPMRPNLVSLRNLLRTSLLAKVVLGTTIALSGAGAVAATAGPEDDGPEVVSVVPASEDGADTVQDEPPALVELDEEDADDDADEDTDDGPDAEDADGDADEDTEGGADD